MDILTHTISGIAVGTVVASFAQENKTKIILASAFAGALPDVDVISLWSGFDSSIGRIFDLPRGSDVYFAKYWYSHHGFMHSALAGLIFALFFGLLGFMAKRFRGFNAPIMLSFFLAFLIHLIEDMPTPASTWGGVRFLFPSSQYYGGFGEIWWWNNYDIFLIVLAVALINLFALLFGAFFRTSFFKFITSVFVIGVSLVVYQVKTRPISFSYSGHTKDYKSYEQQSMQIQKTILGKHLFILMDKFDKTLPIYF